jgi:hypothetical protein
MDSSYLLDAFHDLDKDKVLDRFEDLVWHGDIHPTTFEVLREAAKLVNLRQLCTKLPEQDGSKRKNHYMLAQIMRFTQPKRGKFFKLQKEPRGQVPALADNVDASSPAEMIDLGQYDCMVWLRYEPRTCWFKVEIKVQIS